MTKSKFITGITKTGFKFKIDKAIADDMEIFELIEQLDEGNTTALPKLLNRLLGESQKKALYDHVRNEAGRVPIEAAFAEIKEILTTPGELKN